MPTRKPIMIINSVAPIRVCDNGGWTDTWFAGHGRIFNIGVYPYAEVQLAVFPDGDQQERIVIHAENYGERYVVNPEKQWDKHPLLEAAIAYMRVPQNLSFEVTIYSEAPSGAEQRRHRRRRVLLSGRLVHSLNELTVDCAIQDVSSTGARLRLPEGTLLAEPLYLIDLSHGLAFKARVAWRRENRAGLAFSAYYDLGKADGAPKLLRRLWLDHIRGG